MNKRFGHQELPETSQVQFQTSAQGEKETLEEWAERVLCLSPQEPIAGTEACISKPKSMDAALDMIRWCQHTRKAVSAIQKPGKPESNFRKI
ncbi:Hypothetical predicted protein [Mytilus galloprovincialis]|uniref:Uncharacterized protein n=1 Tax=Mytilus galloprovincialis TaxID=29158 RepID=A0A8B6E294_MYTGA|nr:Hypothetical predicted protein [Mytilus galloprovincialis]